MEGVAEQQAAGRQRNARQQDEPFDADLADDGAAEEHEEDADELHDALHGVGAVFLHADHL